MLAAFSVTSFPSRPLFGRWFDAGHPKAALSSSCGLLAVASFAYLIPSMAALFIVRAIHGLGWAGLNTIGSAWVANLAPVARRAEAVGYFTVAQSSSVAIAPVVGLWLYAQFGFELPFIVAGAFALAAVIAIQLTRPSTVSQPTARPRPDGDEQPPAPRSFWLARVLEPSALLGTSILAAMQLNTPALYNFVPLYFLSLEVPHVEVYFLAQGLTSMVGRGALGRWADRVGRMRSIGWGCVVQLGGLVLLGQSTELAWLVIAGVIVTLGQSMSHPSLYALVIDRAPAHRRGTALATYTMGFQLGSGVGAVLFGVVIEHFGYRITYLASLLPVLLALALVIANRESEGLRRAS